MQDKCLAACSMFQYISSMYMVLLLPGALSGGAGRGVVRGGVASLSFLTGGLNGI